MWGGLTVTPKNCTSSITLSWYVPHVVRHIAGQSPYALLVQKQGGYLGQLEKWSGTECHTTDGLDGLLEPLRGLVTEAAGFFTQKYTQCQSGMTSVSSKIAQSRDTYAHGDATAEQNLKNAYPVPIPGFSVLPNLPKLGTFDDTPITLKEPDSAGDDTAKNIQLQLKLASGKLIGGELKGAETLFKFVTGQSLVELLLKPIVGEYGRLKYLSESYGQLSDASYVVAGTLRSPWKWEELIVESAVVGGRTRADGSARWRRRLDGLAADYRYRIDELTKDEPESARIARYRRDLRNLVHLRQFALPIVDELASWPDRATWGDWLVRFDALATRHFGPRARAGTYCFAVASIIDLLIGSNVTPTTAAQPRLGRGRLLPFAPLTLSGPSCCPRPPEARHARTRLQSLRHSRHLPRPAQRADGVADRVRRQQVPP